MRTRRIAELDVNDVTALIVGLTKERYKRETIKKTRDALRIISDFHGIDPNPVRDKRGKLPKERRAHVPPPLAEHVERVAERLPGHHVLPFLIIDACGPRVGELATAQVGDLDEHRKAIRIRSEVDALTRLSLPFVVGASLRAVTLGQMLFRPEAFDASHPNDSRGSVQSQVAQSGTDPPGSP